MQDLRKAEDRYLYPPDNDGQELTRYALQCVAMIEEEWAKSTLEIEDLEDAIEEALSVFRARVS